MNKFFSITLFFVSISIMAYDASDFRSELENQLTNRGGSILEFQNAYFGEISIRFAEENWKIAPTGNYVRRIILLTMKCFQESQTCKVTSAPTIIQELCKSIHPEKDCMRYDPASYIDRHRIDSLEFLREYFDESYERKWLDNDGGWSDREKYRKDRRELEDYLDQRVENVF